MFIVREYIQWANTRASWQGYTFAQKSYSEWASKELLCILEQNSEKPPLALIEDFRDRMDEYSCISKTTDASYIFSVAYDVAQNIIDLLIV